MKRRFNDRPLFITRDEDEWMDRPPLWPTLVKVILVSTLMTVLLYVFNHPPLPEKIAGCTAPHEGEILIVHSKDSKLECATWPATTRIGQ